MTARLAKFEVDPEGMRELQEGREPWQLAKEIVANAFDEESVKTVTASLTKDGNRLAVFTVEDDGGGFSDLRYAWTLYASTAKRSQSHLRGRFCIGEKEILAVASKGSIETTTGSVKFDGTTRMVGRKKRDYGTRVELHLPWTHEQVEKTTEKLKEVDPPRGIFYTMNGSQVGIQDVLHEIRAILDTPLLDGNAMRLVRRETAILVKRPKGHAVVQELGIPVQEIDCPWTIDVRQKIPMPPNRDTVKDTYLQDLYAEVLNTMVHQLAPEESSANWIRIGSVDPRCTPSTADLLRELRFGEKAVLWSSDTLANERAREAGYTVIPPRLLNAEEKDTFGAVGLQYSSDVFGLTPTSAPSVEPNDQMKLFAGVVKRLGRDLLGMEVGVHFYSLPEAYEGAQWSFGTVSFNVGKLGRDFFEEMGKQQIRVILHEFAHHHGRGPDDEPHGSQWKENLQNLAAELVVLVKDDPKILYLPGAN